MNAAQAMNTLSPPYYVSSFIVHILDYKYHVESRQNGRHEVYVFLSLRVIPPAKDAVGGSKNRTPGVEGGCDASLVRKINNKYKLSKTLASVKL